MFIQIDIIKHNIVDDVGMEFDIIVCLISCCRNDN